LCFIHCKNKKNLTIDNCKLQVLFDVFYERTHCLKKPECPGSLPQWQPLFLGPLNLFAALGGMAISHSKANKLWILKQSYNGGRVVFLGFDF
jgi:hypothetical protein